MFVPFIVILISSLVILNYQAVHDIIITSSEQHFQKINVVDTFLNEEIIVSAAAESYCINNIDDCKSREDNSTNTIDLNSSDIDLYMPNLTDLNFGTAFTSVVIDTANYQIILSHNLDSTERDKYFNYYKNKNAYCTNESSIPCDSDSVSTKKAITTELEDLLKK